MTMTLPKASRAHKGQPLALSREARRLRCSHHCSPQQAIMRLTQQPGRGLRCRDGLQHEEHGGLGASGAARCWLRGLWPLTLLFRTRDAPLHHEEGHENPAHERGQQEAAHEAHGCVPLSGAKGSLG
eukprot:CAMPEP_0171128192 /NCGR_PEP_ID=MMETSP0766_2-20121228/116633_1 /TAXON_ID=439317 /ORGANISM="Gambierdiscus australes, Strain CAWD 149" /LENGTH=126 /DNA_ID=CAMNT_0011591343 /DNA_START=26 /DNA_END=403 /DNA_ORIENTATION=+